MFRTIRAIIPPGWTPGVKVHDDRQSQQSIATRPVPPIFHIIPVSGQRVARRRMKPGGTPIHRIRFVYTAKHGSWLNRVETWFSILVRRLLKMAPGYPTGFL